MKEFVLNCLLATLIGVVAGAAVAGVLCLITAARPAHASGLLPQEARVQREIRDLLVEQNRLLRLDLCSRSRSGNRRGGTTWDWVQAVNAGAQCASLLEGESQ